MKIGLETGTFLWIPYIANEYNEMDISHENRPWFMGPIAYRIGPNRIGPILSIIEAVCKCKLHVHCTLYVTYFSGYSDSILLGIRCPGPDPLLPKNFTPPLSIVYSILIVGDSRGAKFLGGRGSRPRRPRDPPEKVPHSPTFILGTRSTIES